MVCLLKRLLYRLKQSPRQWYKRFDTFITKQGFNRSYYYACLYFKGTNITEAEYLLLYVDDILLISKSKNKVERLKKVLNTEFEIKDLGPVGKILGMKIKKNRVDSVVFLSQEGYLKKLIDKFSMKEAKPAKQPFTSQH